MAELTPKARRRIYRAVCYLAHADEDLGLAERALLEELRLQLDIDAEEAAALEEEGRKGESIRLKPDSQEATFALRVLVLMMLADDVLHPAEAERLKHIAERLEVGPERLTNILRLAMIQRNQRRSRD